MHRSFRPYLLILAGFLLAPFALGAEKTPWYQVELIVFARPNASAAGEVWPSGTGAPVPAASGRSLVAWTGSTRAGTVPFQRLPSTALKLGWEYTRFKGNLKPLLHIGWLQPGLGPDDAVPVRISGGSNEAGTISGTVKVVLSRYLHLDTDLTYQRPGDDNLPAGARPLFTMTESRRMRSREIHYLDNPMFGVVALITPYTTPAGKGAPAR